MLKKYSVFIIILILLSFLLTGCRDSSEVDDNIYAVAIGLDKGVNNKVTVTIQYPNYRSIKGVEKTKKEYKTDVFDFGKNFAGYFPTIQEWQSYNWLSHYPEAKVNVNVEVNVRRTGLMIESSPIIEGPESK